MKWLRFRYLVVFEFLFLVVGLLFKPLLNASGMCTAGPLGQWHYVSMEETLAYLNSRASKSRSGYETQYIDASTVRTPKDARPERKLLNQLNGGDRFLIEAEMRWQHEGKAIAVTNWFFSPNCLEEYIPEPELAFSPAFLRRARSTSN